MTDWKDPHDAPRDGNPIVGRFQRRDGQLLSQQQVMLAAWNEWEDGWARASWRFEESGDLYLMTDFGPGMLTGWQELPAVSALLLTTAPVKSRPFLADRGYPWPVLTCWCPVVERYFHAELQMSWCQGLQDVYFECESMDRSEIERWDLLPAPARGADW